MIKKTIKRILSNWRRKGIFGFQRNPHRDWRAVCALFVFLCAVSALVHWYIFSQVSSGDFFAPGKTALSAKSVIDGVALDKVISSFDGKQARFQEMQKNPPAPFDPSL